MSAAAVAARTRQHARAGIRSLLDPASTWAAAWDFSRAPDSPGPDVEAFAGSTTLSLTAGAYTKGHGTAPLHARAAGLERVEGAIRMSGGGRWSRGGYATTSTGVRIRFIGRFPSTSGAVGFSWGTAVGALTIEKLGAGPGQYQFTLVQDSVQQDQRTIDVGADGWVLIDAHVAPSGPDVTIEYGVNGQTATDSLTSVTYTGFPGDLEVAPSSFDGGDLLFVGVEQTNAWNVAGHTRDYNRSGLDFSLSPPTSFLRVAEDNRADIPSADVDAFLDGQEEVLLAFWARRSHAENVDRILGRPDQIDVRTQEIGASVGARFSAARRNIIDSYSWKVAWDFSQAPSVSGDVPALAGGLDLTLESGTYTGAQSTGRLVADAITSARVDGAIDPGGSAELGASGGVLALPASKKVHFRWIGQWQASSDFLTVGTPGGRRIQIRATASMTARYYRDDGGSLLSASVPSPPSAGDWLLLDVVIGQDDSDPTRTTGVMYLNGVEGTAVSSPPGEPYTGVPDGQIDVLHYNGGGNSSGAVLFAGFREVDDFPLALHEADWDASGLATSVFDTFTWDYAWNLADAVTPPGSAPQTSVVPAYAGTVDLDLITGSGIYTVGEDTGPVAEAGVPSGVVGDAMGFDYTVELRATDASIVSTTPYHVRAIAQMPAYTATAQPALINIGQRAPTAAHWYVYLQPGQGGRDAGRVLIRALMSGVTSTAYFLDRYRPGDWLFVDAWLGEDPNNASNVLFRLMVNGRWQDASVTGTYPGPTVGVIDVGHADEISQYNGPLVFAAARRTATPPTLEDHTRDWVRSGIATEYASPGSVVETGLLADGEWHHIACLYRGERSPLVAVDGSVLPSTEVNITPKSLPASAEDLRLGGDSVEVAKLQIWPARGLTARDFPGLYKAASTANPEQGFAGHNDPSAFGYYNALSALTGLTQTGSPHAGTESEADYIDGFDWAEAWDFSSLPTALTPGRTNWDSADPDYYLDFAAATSYQLSGPAFLNTQGQFTAEFWFRSSSAPATGASERIWGRPGQLDIRKLDDGGTTKLRVVSASPYTYTSDSGVTALEDGAWHHFVCTIEFGVGVNLYVDGVAVAGTASGTIPATNPGGSNFEFGCANGFLGASTNQQFDLARFGLYPVAVSGAEAATLYGNFEDRRVGPDFIDPKDTLIWEEGVGFTYYADGGYRSRNLVAGLGSLTRRYAETVTSLVGGTDLGLVSGAVGDEQSRASLTDAAVGSINYYQNQTDGAGLPLRFFAEPAMPTGTFHVRCIFRVRKPDTLSIENFVLNVGQSWNALHVLCPRSFSSDRVDIQVIYTRDNSPYMSAILNTAPGAVGERFQEGDTVLLDIVVGPDPSNPSGSQLVVMANGDFTSVTTPPSFQDLWHDVLQLNGDRSLQEGSLCDLLFVGIRQGTLDLFEHLEMFERHAPRATLVSGRYWDKAWDFAALTSNSQDPVPPGYGDVSLTLSSGAYTLTDIDTNIYNPVFSKTDIGPRSQFALFGASGALLTGTNAYFQKASGFHFRLLFRGTGSAVTLFALSAATDPSLTVTVDGSNRLVAGWTDGTETLTASPTATVGDGEWGFVDVWMQPIATGGTRLDAACNGTTATDTTTAADFPPLGTNTLEVGGSNGTADSADLGILFLGMVGEDGPDLLYADPRPDDRFLKHWTLAYRGGDATAGSWAPWKGSGPTLTGTGTSTLGVRTGAFSEGNLGDQINQGVKRVSGSSHAASSGFTYPDPEQPYFVRCIFKPTTTVQTSGEVVWCMIEQEQAGVDRYIALRRAAPGFQLDWFTEDAGNSGTQLTEAADSITITGINLDEWNLVDVEVIPDSGAGTTEINIWVNGSPSPDNGTVTYGDPTFGAASVGLGLLNRPNGTGELADAEIVFWGLCERELLANEHRAEWNSGPQFNNLWSAGWSVTWYNQSNL